MNLTYNLFYKGEICHKKLHPEELYNCVPNEIIQQTPKEL